VMGLVATEARLRPVRWRRVVRHAIHVGGKSAPMAAKILDEIGERDDISLLRSFAKAHRSSTSSSLGRGLARRLAPPAHIADLGHVMIEVGDRLIDGSSV